MNQSVTQKLWCELQYLVPAHPMFVSVLPCYSVPPPPTSQIHWLLHPLFAAYQLSDLTGVGFQSSCVFLLYQSCIPFALWNPITLPWLMQLTVPEVSPLPALCRDIRLSASRALLSICLFQPASPRWISFTGRHHSLFPFLPSSVRVLLLASTVQWKWGHLHGNMLSHPWLTFGWNPIAAVRQQRGKRNNNLTRLMNIDHRGGALNTACLLFFVQYLIQEGLCTGAPCIMYVSSGLKRWWEAWSNLQ